MEQFISASDARAAILHNAGPLGPERVFLADADSRVLSEDVVASGDLPAFDNSAMDGIAFRHPVDGPLRLVGTSAAGVPFEGVVRDGEAVRIMTGAPLPNGTDTVAPREIVSFGEDLVELNNPVAAGANVRLAGEYLRAGHPYLNAGHLLGPGELGVLASQGRTVVYVHRRPRVTVITTGTELLEPDRVRSTGQIVNSNAYMLEALVRRAGGLPTVAAIIPDELDATTRALEEATSTSDVVISVGGVSVGDFDHVRSVLDELTGGMQFWKVKMKPGKPLAFGRRGGVPIVGLPGNPAAAFVGFHVFVAPLLQRLGGMNVPSQWASTSAVLTRDIRSTPHRLQFVTGRLEPGGFTPLDDQASGNPLMTAGCNALGLVDVGTSHAASGDAIEVMLLSV